MFLLLHSLRLAILDLLDDDFGARSLTLKTLLLSHLIHFQCLEAFDLHHRIQMTFLLFSFTLHHALLLDLRISDGDDLGVKHHLVHMLHIIHVFIQHLLGPFQNSALRTTSVLCILALDCIPLALFFHLPNLFLPCNGFGLPLCVCLCFTLLLLNLLFLAQELGILSQAVQLTRRNHHRLLLCAGLGMPVVPLAHHNGVFSYNHHFSLILLANCPVASRTKQCLIHICVVIHGAIARLAFATARGHGRNRSRHGVCPSVSCRNAWHYRTW
mmetsp:Transcript_59863/g.97869  ORF Transcript_59863/g.97869 Transcript_59863/m.97869 type:complete len:270 (+) Transcript_59863:858-1667(+)